MSTVVAVLGATGAVGREMVATLERRDFCVRRLVLLATPRSAGTCLPYCGESVRVESVGPDSFKGVDIALFSAGAKASLEYARQAAAAGAVVVDNSSAWRMHDQVPLVVPEVNPQAAKQRPLGIIANPNCSTIQLVVALKPLHDAARVRHIVVSTYQSVSGKGHAAVEELWSQTRCLVAGEPLPTQVMPGQIAMNLLCDWKSGSNEYSEEEWKMVHETRKIFGDASIGISPTTVRVPVANAHAESVHVTFHRAMSRTEALSLLRNAAGVELMDEPYGPGRHPQPIHASGRDPVLVGRVREDLAVRGALNLWIVADNLRKGAALNAVQIAEGLQR